MDVFACGSPVLVGPDIQPVTAQVLEFAVSGGGHVEYRVAFWDDEGERVVEWLEACEVRAHDDSSTVRVGRA